MGYFVKWCKGVSALIKETMSLKLDLDPISNAELGGLLNKLFETDFYFKRFGKHGKGIDLETGKPYHTAKMVHRVCSRVVGCPSKMWLKVPLNEKSDNPDAFYHDIRVDEEEDIVEDGEVDEEGGNGGHGVEDR